MEDGEDDSDPLSSFQKFFENLKRSRLFKYVFFCVLISEIIDWLATVMIVFYIKSPAGDYTAIIGAVAISYYLVDYSFDLLWSCIGFRLYKDKWFKSAKKVVLDICCFSIIDRFVWPIFGAIEISLSFWLLSCGLSGISAISLASGILIPPYILAFLIAGAPLILKREKSISI